MNQPRQLEALLAAGKLDGHAPKAAPPTDARQTCADLTDARQTRADPAAPRLDLSTGLIVAVRAP